MIKSMAYYAISGYKKTVRYLGGVGHEGAAVVLLAPILAPLPHPTSAAVCAHVSIAASVHAHLWIAAIDSFLAAHPAHTIRAHMDPFPRIHHPPHAMVLRNRLVELVGDLAVEDGIGRGGGGGIC
jgi:hypothetical protein